VPPIGGRNDTLRRRTRFSPPTERLIAIAFGLGQRSSVATFFGKSPNETLATASAQGCCDQETIDAHVNEVSSRRGRIVSCDRAEDEVTGQRAMIATSRFRITNFTES